MDKKSKVCFRRILFASKLILALWLTYAVFKVAFIPRYFRRVFSNSVVEKKVIEYTNETGKSQRLSFENYAELLDKNPFSRSEQTTKVSQKILLNPSSESSKAENLELVLTGTVSGNPTLARAIIKNLKTGAIEQYKIGQAVANAQIESIKTDTVILLHNGRRRILKLNVARIRGDNDNILVSPSRPVNKNQHAKTEQKIKQNIKTQPARNNHVEAILQNAVIKPYVVEDRVEGLKITGLENINLAKKFGLKNGDIMRMVNGHRLTSKQRAYQVLKKAKTQKAIDIELLRGNKAKKLSFTKK